MVADVSDVKTLDFARAARKLSPHGAEVEFGKAPVN
jgi:hypothetical protein